MRRHENAVSSRAGPSHLSVDDLPVPIGVRLIARRHLDDAAAAHARLHGRRDTEALHDFRVALRRLRSTIRAYRAALDDTVKRADRQALRAIARATSATRDLEVQLAWLRRRRGMSPDAAAGARILANRLRKEKRDADRKAMDVVARFAKTRERLQTRLTHYSAEIDPVDPLRTPTTAETAAATAVLYAASLSTRMATVRNVEDGARAHGARIAGKRLRYLLEPYQPSAPNGESTIELLKSFQDDFGDLHDLDVMLGLVSRELARSRRRTKPPNADDETAASGEPRVLFDDPSRLEKSADGADAAEAASPSPPSVEPLAALEEYVRLQRDTTFSAVQKTWLHGDARSLFHEVDTFAAALRSHAAPEIEIERKYLLRGMPRRKGSRSVRIDQGWLPGERLLERIRRVREADGGVRYYRSLKSGRGIARREIEEETTEQVFRTLWPLTKGRRIAKRRMIVDDGAFTWEIDRFHGRDLVLAEVELPSPETPVVPPRWLEKWVVREVTGEPDYLNSNLAD